MAAGFKGSHSLYFAGIILISFLKLYEVSE